jgi:hypothetical protein
VITKAAPALPAQANNMIDASAELTILLLECMICFLSIVGLRVRPMRAESA